MGYLLGGPGHLSRSTLQGTSVQHRQPVPIRPHLSISPTTATLVADFLAYKNDDTNARIARMGGAQSQRLGAIKSSVILALGTSTFAPYSNLAQQYRQMTMPTRPGATIAWISKAISPTTLPGLRGTRMFRYANANDRPMNGDAPLPASNSHH